MCSLFDFDHDSSHEVEVTVQSYELLTQRDIRSLVFHLLYAAEAFDYQESLAAIVDNFNRGFELAIQIRSKYPTLPVLFMSGYSEGLDQERYISVKDVPLLNKPFTRSQLARQLRAVMSSSEEENLLVANVS